MSDCVAQLRTADLRVTRPRLAVLEAVHTHPHADTETIFSAVRTGLPDVSRQAVYDVLHALTAAGLVRRIQPSGSVARYESRVGDNHHHVVCRSCGVIADVDCAVGDAPCLTASDDNGFVLSTRRRSSTGACAPTARRQSINVIQPVNHPERNAVTIHPIAARPTPDTETRSGSESENPAIDSPKPKAHAAADEPGLVARPGRRVGAARALVRGATHWVRTSTTPRNSPSSTSKRSRPT